MPTRPNLVATPIVDRTGKQTTVYRKPEAQAGGAASPMPAPTVAGAPAAPGSAAASRAAEYAHRLAAIKADNEKWGPSHPKFLDAVSAASGVLELLIEGAVEAESPKERDELPRHVGGAFEDQRFTQAATAGMYAGLYSGLRESPDADLYDIDALWDWRENQYRTAKDYLAVFKVSVALQTLGLIEISRVPDDTDVLEKLPEEEWDIRFLTHLKASAQGAIDYADYESNEDIIRLLDEYPERLGAISEGIAAGLHEGAIRAQLDGGRAPALLEGEL